MFGTRLLVNSPSFECIPVDGFSVQMTAKRILIFMSSRGAKSNPQLLQIKKKEKKIEHFSLVRNGCAIVDGMIRIAKAM